MRKNKTLKIISALLSAAMLFSLCCCGKTGEETTSEVTTEETTAEVTTYKFDDKVKADGFLTDLLPSDFPSELPADITCKTESLFYADEAEYGYRTDFVRLRLEGSASALSQLANTLVAAGWAGALVVYTETDDDGNSANSVEGYFTDGAYIANVSESTYYDNTSVYAISLDVYEATSSFPEAVAAHFPVFSAVCLGDGEIDVQNKSGEKVENYNNIDNYRWLYTFNDKNLFIGVKFTDLDNYVTALDAAGFKLTESEASNDYGDFIVITGTKTTGGVTYEVKINYVDYLSIAAVKYTNYPDMLDD